MNTLDNLGLMEPTTVLNADWLQNGLLPDCGPGMSDQIVQPNFTDPPALSSYEGIPVELVDSTSFGGIGDILHHDHEITSNFDQGDPDIGAVGNADFKEYDDPEGTYTYTSDRGVGTLEDIAFEGHDNADGTYTYTSDHSIGIPEDVAFKGYYNADGTHTYTSDHSIGIPETD